MKHIFVMGSVALTLFALLAILVPQQQPNV